uniref:Uncharacterized protein n=1 Tax=Arundo donax TaxID=35708 RepID=A0A0A9HTQ4_ARUDO
MSLFKTFEHAEQPAQELEKFKNETVS